MTLGPLTDHVRIATDEALALVDRIAARDHTAWSEDPTELADRLGWLDAPARADEVLDELRALARGVVHDGITDVLLVGMGGSSLYPLVLAEVVGAASGAPRLTVLDSTDPAAVLEVEETLPWATTLLVPASKSGSTVETRSHLARCLVRLRDVHGEQAGRYVLPITDPGSDLEARARAEGFRGVVHGQPDVGGRFSALTPFGLLPAALLGIDLEAHLAPARWMLAAAGSADPAVNEPFVLGAVMAAAARAGRDKLTIVLPEALAPLGLWFEQLIAESTGKHGVGLLPVLGETPEEATFGEDRIVVSLGAHPAAQQAIDAGVPTVVLPEVGAGELTREVVRFEVATAVCGALLGINPFDQPDVQAAKAAASRLLEAGEDVPAAQDPTDALQALGPGDHLALLAFVRPGSDDEAAVRRAAVALRVTSGVPVTVGIGPRYLHSTGQLHKGGPDGGTFLVIVGDDPVDAAIPGEPYTFSRLKRAQAAGDLDALRAAGRTALVVDLATIRGLG
ncbi:MAG: hypothetical protein JJT89_17905 [Nitriliruptoraceae bacterium]|nr:hypothetical protein [Nitriliruptoraceae bacterium]